MDTLPETGLARAVSSLDLNTTLSATNTSLGEGCYTADQLLGSQPKSKDVKPCGENNESPMANDNGKLTSPGNGSPGLPPSPSVVADSNEGVGRALAEDESNESGIQVMSAGHEETKTKKKKKKKSSGVNKKPKPTGFEEFYADPPITPAEHQEESDLYASNIVFHERIQTCIQRYRGRRKLDSVRSNILTKYFMLGGIDTTASAFTGGLDKATIEESSKDDIRSYTATDYVVSGNKRYYDPYDSDNWVVDFEGVAKGFFAHHVPSHLPTDKVSDIKLYTSVVRNFLNYVLAHGACPEYTLDIMAAREICNRAETELCAITMIGLPGDFNIATSTLYGGFYEGSARTWGEEEPLSDAFNGIRGLSVPDSERIFKTAIAFQGTDGMFEKVMAEDVRIVKTENRFYEVVRVHRATEQSLLEYASVKNTLGDAGAIKALGVMIVKSWEGPGLHEEDFTDDEGDTDALEKKGTEKLERFWIEDETLEFVFPGLKMELTVHELNIGVSFFDSVGGLYCSFYTYLINEKMSGWKEPILNPRPPPTEDSPDIEEKAMYGEMEGDMKDDEKIKL